jgi:DNA adenine methylase
MGERAKPFLKWAGGKTRSAALLASLAPPFTGRYLEPFMGSAALFFEFAPERALLSDANKELVVCFQEVARDPHQVMDLLDQMPNTREHYMKVRSQDPETLSRPERAARVIYLNKTGFRGLWRVNRRGQFNVPYGEYSRPYYNADTLLRASKALAGVDIRLADFEEVIAEARPGDFVYLDPPYVPDRKWGDFKRYTPGQFSNGDHDRLAQAMRDADARGAHLMLTNSDTPHARRAFTGFRRRRIATRRDIHLTAAERDSVDLVITNY